MPDSKTLAKAFREEEKERSGKGKVTKRTGKGKEREGEGLVQLEGSCFLVLEDGRP